MGHADGSITTHRFQKAKKPRYHGKVAEGISKLLTAWTTVY